MRRMRRLRNRRMRRARVHDSHRVPALPGTACVGSAWLGGGAGRRGPAPRVSRRRKNWRLLASASVTEGRRRQPTGPARPGPGRTRSQDLGFCVIQHQYQLHLLQQCCRHRPFCVCRFKFKFKKTKKNAWNRTGNISIKKLMCQVYSMQINHCMAPFIQCRTVV